MEHPTTKRRPGRRLLLPVAAVTIGALAVSCSPLPPSGAPTPRATDVPHDDEWGETLIEGQEGLRVRNETSVMSAVVGGSLTATWEALIETYKELEIPVSVFDASSGQIGTEGFRFDGLAGKRASTYLRCGSMMTGANRLDVTLAVMSTVRPAGRDSTLLATEVDAWARPPMTSGNQIHCVTTGRIEVLIREEVGKRLQGEG